MSDPDCKYINRELSWLEFNQRVLDEACDESVPLLERLKFLAITSSNLDEFFMVRVGGLQQLYKQGRKKRDPSGMTAQQQLEAITARTAVMTRQQYQVFSEQLEPRLHKAGIRRVSADQLSERQRQRLKSVFDNEITAVLSPIATDPEQPFPLLMNRGLYTAVRIRTHDEDAPQRFALICCSTPIGRFLTVPADQGAYNYILLEDVVAHFVETFFPSEQILECVPFRITRNADMSVREDQAADLLAQMEEVLDARKQSACVRLEISDRASDELLGYLNAALEVPDDCIFKVPGPIDLSSFMHLTGLSGFDKLKVKPWPPQPSPAVDPKASMFEILAHQDVLLYHPYESFEPVVRLIEEAAADPDVLAIKQTLYRTSRNSPVVAALKKAAQRGKHVTAVVELKARFDEARNIEWARNLEQESVQVIYGVKGLKTHAKVCVIIRREPQGFRKYMHFGTGNYNEVTAKIYSDVSYLTSNEELGADATAFMNAISGFTQPQQLRKLEAAPIGLKERLLEMIRIETRRKTQGQKARIVAKLNSLVDPQIIDALYEASQAGVEIKLNIRGICCLKPGIPDLSDKITVISIVDRFLEHARIFYFYHGGDERVFISSADWMPRNLKRRVELLVPVEDTASRQRLINILGCYFKDNVKARRLLSDGSYEPVVDETQKAFRSQEVLYREARDAHRQAEQQRPTVFEPYRAPSAEY